MLGITEGDTDGEVDGEALGLALGLLVGAPDGLAVGEFVGLRVVSVVVAVEVPEVVGVVRTHSRNSPLAYDATASFRIDAVVSHASVSARNVLTAQPTVP